MIAFGHLLLIVFPALLVVAALYDLVTMTIPNRLPVLIAAVFPVAAITAGMGASLIGWHFLAGVVVLCLCFGLFALNWIGGGDAKLAAAVALWIGPSMPLLDWAILTGVYGGVMTLALLLLRQLPLPMVLSGQSWIARLHHPETGVPYGIALSAAGLIVYPSLDIYTRLAI